MRGKKVFVVLFTLAVSFMGSFSLAQEHDKKGTKVLINFEEDLIKGSLTGSELFLILQKDQTKFNRLFDSRENFKREMYEDLNFVGLEN